MRRLYSNHVLEIDPLTLPLDKTTSKREAYLLHNNPVESPQCKYLFNKNQQPQISITVSCTTPVIHVWCF